MQDGSPSFTTSSWKRHVSLVSDSIHRNKSPSHTLLEGNMQRCEYQEVGVLGAILRGCLPQLVQESQTVRILASSSLIYFVPFCYPSHDSDSEILLDQYIFPTSPFSYASIFLFCPERLRYSEKPMSAGIPKVRPNSNPNYLHSTQTSKQNNTKQQNNAL